MEDIVNNNIKLIMLDLVGVLVFERDDVLNDKEDKIERLFGPNLSDEEYLKKAENAYIELASVYKWKTVECVENNTIKSIEQIGDEVLKLVLEK